MAEYVFIQVHPQRFANRYTIYAAPAGRAAELERFVEGQCPSTGYYSEISFDQAAGCLWHVPERAYGWTELDIYEPTDDEVSLHCQTCTGRKSDPRCVVCHPPTTTVKDQIERLVARVVAELDRS
jgi:hypothetical protein